MSTSVEISSRRPIQFDLDKICGDKYYYGVRDKNGIVRMGEKSNFMVVFNYWKMGRGVELDYTTKKKIGIRINAPAATSDFELFMDLLQEIIKDNDINEVICEGETFSVEAINEIRKLVRANMESGLDFLLHPPTKEEIGIMAVREIMTINDNARAQIGDNQKGFDNYLYKKQIRPITAKDLAAKNPSPEVRAIYDRALKKAYEDQQKVLKAAAKFSK